MNETKFRMCFGIKQAYSDLLKQPGHEGDHFSEFFTKNWRELIHSGEGEVLEIAILMQAEDILVEIVGCMKSKPFAEAMRGLHRKYPDLAHGILKVKRLAYSTHSMFVDDIPRQFADVEVLS